MIITIILVSLAFLWLGYETNWMTIRLNSTAVQAMYGQSSEWVAPPEYMSWQDICSDINCWQTRHQPFWFKYPEQFPIPCDVEWLESQPHPIPINKVELYFGNGYKQTFTLKKPELLKQIIHINCGKKYFKRLAEQAV